VNIDLWCPLCGHCVRGRSEYEATTKLRRHMLSFRCEKARRKQAQAPRKKVA
jgi:hypothetical protein